MKVILVYPGITNRGFDSYGKSNMESSWISHGLCSISAFAKKYGYLVELIDLRRLKGWDDFALLVREKEPDVVGMTMMSVDYKSEFTVYLESVLTNNTQLPTRIYGQHGTIELDGKPQLTANGDFVKEFRELNNGYDQVIIPSQNQRDMEGNFIDAIRKDEKLFCNVDLGCTTMVAIKMGVEAYRQSKTMLWDAENDKVISG